MIHVCRYIKHKYCFNLLCLNENLNFCLMCLFTNNTDNTINITFYGFCTLCGGKCVKEAVCTSNFIKNDDLFCSNYQLNVTKVSALKIITTHRH